MTFRPPKGNLGKKPLLKFSTEPCTYKHYNCSQPCLENYSLCVRHILEDKNAPFKQCNYIYTVTGRRCPLPAPKGERNERRESYCAEHVRKIQLRHQKHRGTPQPPLTRERLLSSISHYVKVPDSGKNQNQNKSQLDDYKNNENTSSAQEITSDASERENIIITKCLNPFVDINATSINNSLHKVLEYCSESDSDVDVTTVDKTVRVKDEDSSDAESVDSAGEDVFKHANVYTPEEVTLRTKEKLIRLQTLYIEQFKRLQHILKERRRDYLHALQKEKETLCSIADQPKDTVKEQKLFEKLKSLNHYHKRYGIEAILHKKALERRTLVTEGIPNKQSSSSKCIFTEGGVKCSLKTLPCAKYCNKHILQDTHQMLFRPCGINKGVSTCQEPVLHIFPNENCVFHFNIPPAQLTYNTHLSSEDELEESPIKQTEKIESKVLKVKEDLQKVEPMDELPLQIMETKEDSASNLHENEGEDQLYYMNENCMGRPDISQEYLRTFESDDSGVKNYYALKQLQCLYLSNFKANLKVKKTINCQEEEESTLKKDILKEYREEKKRWTN